MTHLLDAASLLTLTTSVLYIGLGLWVFTLTPRRSQTTWLAIFSIAFGIRFLVPMAAVLAHLVAPTGPYWGVLYATMGVAVGVAVLGLAWTVPEPLEDRRSLTIAAGGAGIFGLAILIVLFAVGPDPGESLFGHRLFMAQTIFEFVPLIAAFLLPAIRARPESGIDRAGTRQLAILAIALAMVRVFSQGSFFVEMAWDIGAGEAMMALDNAAFTLPFLVVAGIWGWNMVRAPPETVRIHRAVMLATLGLLTGGALWGALAGILYPPTLGWGIAQALGVGLLAYGILRHDLAGLDAKVEYGVSKTTVAGIFVAVFFVVSEGAQALFADFAGNEFLGIIAAGTLLFALAPIQRAADRVAERAVPAGGGRRPDHLQASGSRAVEDEEATYRLTVEKYLADGELTRDEEQHLARLATRLGIPAERAFELREQIEDETSRNESSGGDDP